MVENKSDSPDEEMDTYDFIRGITPRRTLETIIPDVSQSKTLLDAIRCILCHNTYQNNHETLTEHQEQIFEIIEQLRERPQTMFTYLRKHFAKHFDINLSIIAFHNGKFSLTNKDNDDKKNMAFLSFNEDNIVCGPLYTINDNGTMETVFSSENGDILLNVYIYVTQLNHSKLPTNFHQIQEQQAVHGVQVSVENSLTDNISTSTNQVNPANPVQLDDKTKSRIVLDQMLQQMFRVIDNLPINPQQTCQVLQSFVSTIANSEYLSNQDPVMASKYGIDCLSLLVQLAQQPITVDQNEYLAMSQLTPANDINSQNIEIQNETNQITYNVENLLNISPPNDVSTTTVDIDNSTIETPMDISNNYIPPTMVELLEGTFHPRTLNEFAETGSSPVRCVNSKQRGPLEIRVPPDDGIQLYLFMELVDLYDQTHPSKIIVPEKTQAKNELLINNNDLECLDFSQCHKDDAFDRDAKQLCSKISIQERNVLRKKIRIHMINLYQRGNLKRKMAQNQGLKKCKLALWFCILENGEYKRASPISYSNVTEEREKCTKTKKKNVGQKRKKVSKTHINEH